MAGKALKSGRGLPEPGFSLKTWRIDSSAKNNTILGLFNLDLSTLAMLSGMFVTPAFFNMYDWKTSKGPKYLSPTWGFQLMEKC